MGSGREELATRVSGERVRRGMLSKVLGEMLDRVGMLRDIYIRICISLKEVKGYL